MINVVIVVVLFRRWIVLVVRVIGSIGCISCVVVDVVIYVVIGYVWVFGLVGEMLLMVVLI